MSTKTIEEVKEKINTKFAPMWSVILHNDDDHSWNYVISMLVQLFGMSQEKAIKHTEEVDKLGRSVVDVTTFERAELKRDQIHAFGKDPEIAHCKGSMSASIEPVE